MLMWINTSYIRLTKYESVHVYQANRTGFPLEVLKTVSCVDDNDSRVFRTSNTDPIALPLATCSSPLSPCPDTQG